MLGHETAQTGLKSEHEGAFKPCYAGYFARWRDREWAMCAKEALLELGV